MSGLPNNPKKFDFRVYRLTSTQNFILKVGVGEVYDEFYDIIPVIMGKKLTKHSGRTLDYFLPHEIHLATKDEIKQLVADGFLMDSWLTKDNMEGTNV